MAQRTISELQALFEAGDQPTQQNFWDIFDSFVTVGDTVFSAFGVNITGAGYNAVGNGITDNVAAFLQANTDLAAIGGGDIYIPVTADGGDYRIADDIAFDDSVRLHFMKGAKISVGAGATVSNVDLAAPPNTQIFDGAGTVTLGDGQRAVPNWWGALPDDASDNFDAFSAANASLAASGGGVLHVPVIGAARYHIASNLAFGNNVVLEIERGAVLVAETGVTVSNVNPAYNHLGQMFDGDGTFTLKQGVVHIPEWWGVLADDTTDNTVAFSKVAAALPATGGKVVLLQNALPYLYGSQVTVSEKENVELHGIGGATLKMAASADWGSVSRYGWQFLDCNHVKVKGVVWDGNGVANQPLNTDFMIMLVLMSSFSDVNDFTSTSEDITVEECQFRNFHSCALAARLVNGVHFNKNVFRDAIQQGQSAGTGPLAAIRCARCNDIWVQENDIEGNDASTDSLYFRGCSVVIDAAGNLTAPVDGWQVGINACNPINYHTLKTFTAPEAAEATSEAVVSYVDENGGDGAVGENEFFFLCKDAGSGANSGVVASGNMRVIDVDTDAKTFTVERTDGAQTPAAVDWAGQTVYWESVNTERFCKNIHVLDNRMKNCHGVFLLGCREFEVRGNTAENTRDISLDVEYGKRGVFADNTIERATNDGIALIFLTVDITVHDNLVKGRSDSAGISGTSVFSRFSMSRNINIHHNTYSGVAAVVTPTPSAFDNIIDGLRINHNICDGKRVNNNGNLITSGIEVRAHNLTDVGGYVRDVEIAHNLVKNYWANGFQYGKIDGLRIVHNTFRNLGRNSIFDDNASAHMKSSRVAMGFNTHDNIGYTGASFRAFNSGATMPDLPHYLGGDVWLNADPALDGTQNFWNDSTTPGNLSMPISEMGARKTYDPGSLLTDTFAETTFTILGAIIGYEARATFSNALQGIELIAEVSGTDTVTVRFWNRTGSTIALGSGTLRATVHRV